MSPYLDNFLGSARYPNIPLFIDRTEVSRPEPGRVVLSLRIPVERLCGLFGLTIVPGRHIWASHLNFARLTSRHNSGGRGDGFRGPDTVRGPAEMLARRGVILGPGYTMAHNAEFVARKWMSGAGVASLRRVLRSAACGGADLGHPEKIEDSSAHIVQLLEDVCWAGGTGNEAGTEC
jgi:hypothetical protein